MQMLTSLDVLWSVYRIANMWGALQIIVNYDPLDKLRQLYICLEVIEDL